MSSRYAVTRLADHSGNRITHPFLLVTTTTTTSASTKAKPSIPTFYFCGFPSADKLREKAEKTAGLCVGQGIGNFCIAGSANRKGLKAKRFQPAVFSALCVKGLVRQRSLSADLIFWLLLYQDKSNSLRGN